MANNFDALSFLSALAQTKKRLPLEIPGVNVPDVDPYGFGPIPFGGKPPNPITRRQPPSSPYLMANPPPPQQAPVQGPPVQTPQAPQDAVDGLGPPPTRAQFTNGIPDYQLPPEYAAPVRNVAGERRQNLTGLAGTLFGALLSGNGRNAASAVGGYYNGAKGAQDESYNAQVGQAQNDYANKVARVNASNQIVTRRNAQAESAYDDAVGRYNYDATRADRKTREAAAAQTAADKAAQAENDKKTAATRSDAEERARTAQAYLVNPAKTPEGVAQARRDLHNIKVQYGIGPGANAPEAAAMTPAQIAQNKRAEKASAQSQANSDRNYNLSSARFDWDKQKKSAEDELKAKNGGITPTQMAIEERAAGNDVRQYGSDVHKFRTQQQTIKDQIAALHNISQSGFANGLTKLVTTGFPDTEEGDYGAKKVRALTGTDRQMINRKLKELGDAATAMEGAIRDAATQRNQYANRQKNAIASMGIPNGVPTAPIPVPPKPLPGIKPPKATFRDKANTAPVVIPRNGGGTISIVPM